MSKTKKVISLLVGSVLAVGAPLALVGCSNPIPPKPNIPGYASDGWEWDDDDQEWEFDDGHGRHFFYYGNGIHGNSVTGSSSLSNHARAVSGGYAKPSVTTGRVGGFGSGSHGTSSGG